MKNIYFASPLIFLFASAAPAPYYLEFGICAFLGSFSGAMARFGLSVYTGEVVENKIKAAALTYASFWLGMVGATILYAVPIPGIGKLVSIEDPITIIAAASCCSLFGVLLEMLAKKLIIKKQKEL